MENYFLEVRNFKLTFFTNLLIKRFNAVLKTDGCMNAEQKINLTWPNIGNIMITYNFDLSGYFNTFYFRRL